jgi:hypothetical protein
MARLAILHSRLDKSCQLDHDEQYDHQQSHQDDEPLTLERFNNSFHKYF